MVDKSKYYSTLITENSIMTRLMFHTYILFKIICQFLIVNVRATVVGWNEQITKQCMEGNMEGNIELAGDSKGLVYYVIHELNNISIS